MKTILITGGTGLIGSHLTPLLLAKNYKVRYLSRHKREIANVEVYEWDIKKEFIENGALNNVDVIIHLAGANIGEKRWTSERKKEIISSRVDSLKLLQSYISQINNKPQVLVSASAVGYYGMVTSDHIFNEEDKPVNDFLSETCIKWENAANEFKQYGLRVAKLRTAVVLAPKRSALDKLALPARFGFAAPFGKGNQFWPWVHIDDISQIYLKAIEDEKMNDSVNASAPEQVTNNQFNKTLSKVLKMPYFMPAIPGIILKVVLGEMANALLKGSPVSCNKILSKGYKFKFPLLKGALEDCLKRKC